MDPVAGHVFDGWRVPEELWVQIQPPPRPRHKGGRTRSRTGSARTASVLCCGRGVSRWRSPDALAQPVAGVSIAVVRQTNTTPHRPYPGQEFDLTIWLDGLKSIQ